MMTAQERQNANSAFIQIDSDWERRNWMHWLHCSEEELRRAVESIGADPDNVRRFLRQERC